MSPIKFSNSLASAVTADDFNALVPTVDNYAQARAFNAGPPNRVYVGGAYVPGDGGQGMFTWVQGSVTDDNASALVITNAYPPAYWSRLSSGQTVPDVISYGGDPTGVRDSSAAFLAVQAALFPNGGLAIIPKGYFKISDPTALTVNCPIIWQGYGGSNQPNNQTIGGFTTNAVGSVLLADTATPGWVFNDYTVNTGTNTINSELRNLYVFSKGGGSVDGLWMRQAVRLYGCFFRGWSRYGVRVESNTAGHPFVGNDNCWYMENTTIYVSGDTALYVAGNNSNAGTCVNINIGTSGNCGIDDQSLIGNNYVGGQIVGTASFAMRTRDTAPTTVTGLYVESGWFCDFGDTTTAIGQLAGQAGAQSGTTGFAMSGGLAVAAPYSYLNTKGAVTVRWTSGLNDTTMTVDTFGSSDDALADFNLFYDSSAHLWRRRYAGAIDMYTLPLTQARLRKTTFGLPNGFYNGTQLIVPPAAAAPTTGLWNQSDVVPNSAAAAGGTPGWMCTTGGAVATVNWAATTAYNVNDIRLNDTGKTYICTVAGTSAGSGGPTGTGTGIVDGTVTWDYSAGFTFKAMANLAA